MHDEDMSSKLSVVSLGGLPGHITHTLQVLFGCSLSFSLFSVHQKVERQSSRSYIYDIVLIVYRELIRLHDIYRENSNRFCHATFLYHNIGNCSDGIFGALIVGRSSYLLFKRLFTLRFS